MAVFLCFTPATLLFVLFRSDLFTPIYFNSNLQQHSVQNSVDNIVKEQTVWCAMNHRDIRSSYVNPLIGVKDVS